MTNELYHYGRSKRDGAAVGSGRYPLGSGKSRRVTSDLLDVYTRRADAANKRKRNREDLIERLTSPTIKSGKDRPPMSPAEKIGKESLNVFEQGQKINSSAKNISKRNKAKDNPAAKLSDDELRRAINRLQMERTYNSLTQADTASGFDVAEDLLNIVGGIGGIAVSAAVVYSIVRDLKKVAP